MSTFDYKAHGHHNIPGTTCADFPGCKVAAESTPQPTAKDAAEYAGPEHCKYGHKFTLENTIEPTGDHTMGRKCRKCKRAKDWSRTRPEVDFMFLAYASGQVPLDWHSSRTDKKNQVDALIEAAKTLVGWSE